MSVVTVRTLLKSDLDKLRAFATSHAGVSVTVYSSHKGNAAEVTLPEGVTLDHEALGLSESAKIEAPRGRSGKS